MPNPDDNILAVDVGKARIGLAIANSIAKLAHPLAVVLNSPKAVRQITELAKRENVFQIVVGLPLGLSGKDTEQTKFSREFALKLEQDSGLPVYLSDETLTSVEAEQELRSRGKVYSKSDIDMVAATLILEDYLSAKKRAEEGI